MPDSTPIELVYKGKELDDGTVPVEHMIDALVGFSSAYSKIARRKNPEQTDVGHRIRVLGVKPGSARIIVEVFEFVKSNPAAATVFLTGATVVGNVAYNVVRDIAKVIFAKKHLKDQPVQTSIVFNGPVIMLTNAEGTQLELTKDQLEYLQSGILDSDVDKLTAPLEDQDVSQFELKSGDESLTEVQREDRKYMRQSERTTTTTQDDVWMEGTLNSLTKDKNRGTFYTLGGKHIPYHYTGDDPQQLLQAFSHEGVVRVRGKVSFDADLNPIRIEIKEIQISQGRMF